MPGGDQPGASGSETPDQKIESAATDVPTDQKDKSDVMSDQESSKSDPSHESESGSGLQTPDLTPDCSSSLPSEYKKRSSIDVPSEDKEMSGALSDSETSKSDPCAESDTGSGLQSPDLKTDSSQTPTLEHLEPGKTKTDVIPIDESCKKRESPIEAQFKDPEEMIEMEEVEPDQPVIPLEDINPPADAQVEDADRCSISDLPPNPPGPTAGGPTAGGPTEGGANVRGNIYDDILIRKIFAGLGICIVLILLVALFVHLSVHNRNKQLNVTLPNDTSLPIELRKILNLDN